MMEFIKTTFFRYGSSFCECFLCQNSTQSIFQACFAHTIFGTNNHLLIITLKLLNPGCLYHMPNSKLTELCHIQYQYPFVPFLVHVKPFETSLYIPNGAQIKQIVH